MPCQTHAARASWLPGWAAMSAAPRAPVPPHSLRTTLCLQFPPAKVGPASEVATSCLLPYQSGTGCRRCQTCGEGPSRAVRVALAVLGGLECRP